MSLLFSAIKIYGIDLHPESATLFQITNDMNQWSSCVEQLFRTRCKRNLSDIDRAEFSRQNPRS